MPVEEAVRFSRGLVDVFGHHTRLAFSKGLFFGILIGVVLGGVAMYFARPYLPI